MYLHRCTLHLDDADQFLQMKLPAAILRRARAAYAVQVHPIKDFEKRKMVSLSFDTFGPEKRKLFP